eukprot:g4451.t1
MSFQKNSTIPSPLIRRSEFSKPCVGGENVLRGIQWKDRNAHIIGPKFKVTKFDNRLNNRNTNSAYFGETEKRKHFLDQDSAAEKAQHAEAMRQTAGHVVVSLSGSKSDIDLQRKRKELYKKRISEQNALSFQLNQLAEALAREKGKCRELEKSIDEKKKEKKHQIPSAIFTTHPPKAKSKKKTTSPLQGIRTFQHFTTVVDNLKSTKEELKTLKDELKRNSELMDAVETCSKETFSRLQERQGEKILLLHVLQTVVDRVALSGDSSLLLSSPKDLSQSLDKILNKRGTTVESNGAMSRVTLERGIEHLKVPLAPVDRDRLIELLVEEIETIENVPLENNSQETPPVNKVPDGVKEFVKKTCEKNRNLLSKDEFQQSTDKIDLSAENADAVIQYFSPRHLVELANEATQNWGRQSIEERQKNDSGTVNFAVPEKKHVESTITFPSLDTTRQMSDIPKELYEKFPDLRRRFRIDAYALHGVQYRVAYDRMKYGGPSQKGSLSLGEFIDHVSHMGIYDKHQYVQSFARLFDPYNTHQISFELFREFVEGNFPLPAKGLLRDIELKKEVEERNLERKIESEKAAFKARERRVTLHWRERVDHFIKDASFQAKRILTRIKDGLQNRNNNKASSLFKNLPLKVPTRLVSWETFRDALFRNGICLGLENELLKLYNELKGSNTDILVTDEIEYVLDNHKELNLAVPPPAIDPVSLRKLILKLHALAHRGVGVDSAYLFKEWVDRKGKLELDELIRRLSFFRILSHDQCVELVIRLDNETPNSVEPLVQPGDGFISLEGFTALLNSKLPKLTEEDLAELPKEKAKRSLALKDGIKGIMEWQDIQASTSSSYTALQELKEYKQACIHAHRIGKRRPEPPCAVRYILRMMELKLTANEENDVVIKDAEERLTLADFITFFHKFLPSKTVAENSLKAVFVYLDEALCGSIYKGRLKALQMKKPEKTKQLIQSITKMLTSAKGPEDVEGKKASIRNYFDAYHRSLGDRLVRDEFYAALRGLQLKETYTEDDYSNLFDYLIFNDVENEVGIHLDEFSSIVWLLFE